jgi:hypothetical protein
VLLLVLLWRREVALHRIADVSETILTSIIPPSPWPGPRLSTVKLPTWKQGPTLDTVDQLSAVLMDGDVAPPSVHREAVVSVVALANPCRDAALILPNGGMHLEDAPTGPGISIRIFDHR